MSSCSGQTERSPKVLVGLSDICGYYSQLERGLRELGVDVTLINAFPSLSYHRTTVPDRMGRVVEWLGMKRVAATRGSIRRLFWTALQGASLAIYAVVTLPRYDVYVFASGQSFLAGYDRRFLRLFGKRVVAVCHGTDTRPPWMNAAITGTEGPIDLETVRRETARTKAFVRNLESTVDVVVNHPMSSQFHERPIVQWLEIGIPTAPPREIPIVREPRDDGPVVIIHAPTRPGPKGTPIIEEAIGQLIAEGYSIRFEKITGRPNIEVLEAIARCDFVVDELYSDTPMASFATEAAFFGKPAIVGVRGFEMLKRITDSRALPPAFICSPHEVRDAIRRLVSDRQLRQLSGEEARRFVTQRWSAVEVAKRFQKIIEDRIPESWWFDPNGNEYFHGWGLRDERLRGILRALISAGGPAALYLSDKPELERRVIGFMTEAP